uniref:YtxH-like protein n=1 Tax=Siphoviridae sp. ctWWc42 TaxID=2826361 RepID=A0A8S5R194_9CAUD|nr:MAG TPA: YtxH-like protein [Siphoviridae sp. ctWWc42]
MDENTVEAIDDNISVDGEVTEGTDICVSEEQPSTPGGLLAFAIGGAAALIGGVIYVAKNHKRLGRAVSAGVGAAREEMHKEPEAPTVEVENLETEKEEPKTNAKK